MKVELMLKPSGKSVAQRFELSLDQPAVLGRGGESAVPLDGPQLSRQHLSFRNQSGRVAVTDLSSNGVWVNSKLVGKGQSVQIQDADEVSIPGYAMFVRILPAPVPAATVAVAAAPANAAPVSATAPRVSASAALPASSVPEAPLWRLSGLEFLAVFFSILAAAILWIVLSR